VFRPFDGECGFVVPPNDPVGLAGAIEILAGSCPADGIRRRGRRRIKQSFTPEKYVDAYDAFLLWPAGWKLPAAVRLE
jgi:glycosyltransferase involved in cell wall biosynthesis